MATAAKGCRRPSHHQHPTAATTTIDIADAVEPPSMRTPSIPASHCRAPTHSCHGRVAPIAQPLPTTSSRAAATVADHKQQSSSRRCRPRNHLHHQQTRTSNGGGYVGRGGLNGGNSGGLAGGSMSPACSPVASGVGVVPLLGGDVGGLRMVDDDGGRLSRVAAAALMKMTKIRFRLGDDVAQSGAFT
ncbi:hypothetical protein Dimus_019068 [Dionaea muscipula]